MSDSAKNGIPSDVYIPGLDSIRAHICVEDVISHAPCLHFLEEFDFIEVCLGTQIVGFMFFGTLATWVGDWGFIL